MRIRKFTTRAFKAWVEKQVLIRAPQVRSDAMADLACIPQAVGARDRSFSFFCPGQDISLKGSVRGASSHDLAKG